MIVIFNINKTCINILDIPLGIDSSNNSLNKTFVSSYTDQYKLIPVSSCTCKSNYNRLRFNVIGHVITAKVFTFPKLAF